MEDVKTVVLAQEYIKEHHGEAEFGIDRVCRAVGYSRRQMDRLFQKHVGITLANISMRFCSARARQS